MNNPEEQATLSTRHRTNTKNTTENYNNEPHRSHHKYGCMNVSIKINHPNSCKIKVKEHL
jgi:hypothetical protein